MGVYGDYNEAVQAIKAAILQSQYESGLAVNARQLGLYYAIGGYVSANVRAQKWGAGALEEISGQLQRELPGLRGFSARNMYYMKMFHEEWAAVFQPHPCEPVSALASAESAPQTMLHLQVQNLKEFPAGEFLSIGFTLHRVILEKIKAVEERLFYIRRAAQGHYRVEDIKRSIRNDDYRRQGALPNNFLETIPGTQRALRAIEMFKDEYFLDFINVEELGVRDAADIDERVLEQAIVQNIKNFIMTFGRGFSFISNAYHLDAFGEDQFIDLLFFNRDLNCLVAVELKRGKFKPAYLGQLSGYLSVLDEFERKPHEAPSIGLVLCKDMNEAFVNLVIRNYNSPMGVATYTSAEDMPGKLREALPDIDDLKALLEKADE